MSSILNKSYIVGVSILIGLSSCYDKQKKASPESMTSYQGNEFAPQMYHAESYEPLTQVVDKSSGLNHWPYKNVGGGISDFDSLSDGHGEWYNSNYYNPYGMNMRKPVEGTIAVGKNEFKYNFKSDSSDLWTNISSPIKEGDEVAIEDGKKLYQMNCQHCHGENGDGKGLVGLKFKGVPNYHSSGYRSKTRGDIYYAITFGKNSMRSHAAQVDPLDRWKIAEYIKDWQGKVEAESK